MPGDNPSWEEIVNRVTIASNYAKVRGAAQHWQAAFEQASGRRQSLQNLSERSESWRGAGGNAFRDHIAKVVGVLDKTVQNHERVVAKLNACADHLEAAVRKIPIPSWMYEDVVRMRQDYATNGSGTGGSLEGVRPGEFWGTWVKWVRDQVSDASTIERVLRQGEEFFRNQENIAQQAYAELRQRYAAELVGMHAGAREQVPGVGSVTGPGTGTGDATGPNGPGTQPGGKTNPTTNPTQNNPMQNNPGLNNPGLNNPSLNSPVPPGQSMPTIPPPSTVPNLPPGGVVPGPDVDGGDWTMPDPIPRPSTGLESGGGLGGAGFGGGGGGMGGGPAMGPAVSVPLAGSLDGGAVVGGQGRVGVRGNPAAGAGTGAMGMGMMPMGGYGAGAAGDDRRSTDTWLKEDDDVFGPDTSAPTGVIG